MTLPVQFHQIWKISLYLNKHLDFAAKQNKQSISLFIISFFYLAGDIWKCFFFFASLFLLNSILA